MLDCIVYVLTYSYYLAIFAGHLTLIGEKRNAYRIMRFVIPVVFYEITNVECVYWSDTTVFIGRIYSIFYIRYNYMFRRLIKAIFRLYMKYLLSSYTIYTWAVYMGREGVKWARGLISVRKDGRCGLHEGSMLLPSYV